MSERCATVVCAFSHFAATARSKATSEEEVAHPGTMIVSSK
jgi:hypothetical protein